MIPITRKELYLNKIVGNNEYETPEKPISEEEFFFAEILGEAVQAPEPLTRYQIYLAKIAGKDVEIPYPETRLEYFLARAAGMDVETPAPITREEIYWSNYTATTEFELEGVPPLIFKSDGSALKNYRVYGAAGGVGDYDENSGKYVIPVTVSGKNLLNHIVTNRVIDQTLTVVVNNDRSITVNGASSSTQSINIIQDFIPQSGYTYILSGCPSGGSYSSYTMDMLNNNGIIRADSGNGTSFNADDRIGTLRIRIRIAANYTCNNLTFYPMIRLANAGNSAYEPYTESATINIFLDEPVYEGESVSMADTSIQIGTIDGTNILTVGTEVQPSKVYLKGKIEEIPTRTVSYYSQDGSTLLGTETVESGGNASGLQGTPTKPDTEQYTYTFVGWSNTTNATTAMSGILNNITADKSVYAAFSETEKTFEVDFYNGDTLLETAQNVAYNGTATYTGSTPTKASTAQYDYTFAGWAKTQGSTTVDADALTGVTADRSVYAVFTATARSYTVTFMNVSTLMDTQTVTYGGTAVYGGTTPTKAETSEYTYTFAGWNTNSSASTADADALTNVTADRTVYAIFTAVSKNYTVYFYNGETLLETVTGVPNGGTATYTGATPTSSQTGYIFSGWSPSNTNITADTSCYAQFEAPYITDSWEVISQRSAAGTAQNYYSVGDCKPVYLNGTMGTLALNTTLYVYILGFNHNVSNGEASGITFGGFKTAATNGIDVCLVDSKYGSSDTSGTKYFNMSHRSNYNYGGWKGSDMRYDILGSTDVQPSGYGSAPTTSKTGYDATPTCATNPVANTLMSCLPSDLRAVMKPMTKYTDNVGYKSNVEANVTSSIDYLPLLSEYEVQSARSYANRYEQNKQARYAYYAAGKSKVKYQHSRTMYTAFWWCRSVDCSSSTDFCRVSTSGYASPDDAKYSCGVAPCFLV